MASSKKKVKVKCENPWDVSSLEDFLYFCCPECSDKSQTKDLFIFHALENHPESKERIVAIDKDIENLIIEPKSFAGLLEQADIKSEGEDPIEDESDNLVSEDLPDYDYDISENVEKDSDKNCDPQTVQCYYCGTMHEKEAVVEHQKQVHGRFYSRMCGPPRPEQCSNCKATFQTTRALDLHECFDLFVPKKKPGEPYQCSECPKTYENVRGFRYHISTVHG